MFGRKTVYLPLKQNHESLDASVNIRPIETSQWKPYLTFNPSPDVVIFEKVSKISISPSKNGELARRRFSCYERNPGKWAISLIDSQSFNLPRKSNFRLRVLISSW